MKFLWPAVVLASSAILAAAIVAHGLMLRPARYTFYFDDTPYLRAWRGDTWTGAASLAKPEDGVIQERPYFPPGASVSPSRR